MVARGFKAQANRIVTDVRNEIGLSPFDPLDPHKLALHLDIPIIGLSELLNEAPAIDHLLYTESAVFSAITVFCGSRRTIVHNDAHVLSRQASNLSHELSHGLLLHPPTPALDDIGCRYWNQDIEDEATWLAGALLIPEATALAIAKGRWSVSSAALRFGVSCAMIRYRLNATGAKKRIHRAS